jgi:hemolysin activation/secretion protein
VPSHLRTLILYALVELSLLLATSSASAQLPGDLELTRERQGRLLEEQRRRLEELQSLPGPAKEPSPKAPVVPARCFDIRHIELKGTMLIDASDRATLVAPFEGRCLGPADFNEVLRSVTAYYLDRGYVTSRAYLGEQDLSGGVLEVIVIEGLLEGVVPGSDSRITPRELEQAFPGHAGTILDLRELEQLVDQLNRLPSNQAGVELVPGEVVGGSRALIVNQPDKPWRLTATRHNDGQRSTGEQQWALGLELDSPLGLADQMLLRTGADYRAPHDRASDNAFFQYNLPWGWWNLSYTYSQSHYRTLNEVSGFAFEVSGTSRSHELRAERLLHRDAVSKTSASVSLGQVESRNYIEDVLIDVSSQRLSEVGVGLNHGRRVGSAFVNLDLGRQWGSSAFGGLADRDPAPGEPRAEYGKYTLTASFVQPFVLGGQSFSFDSLASGQHSEDVLYGPRRISIGGASSVRGYKAQALSGDSGGYWRNQLRWRTPVASGALGEQAASWLPAVLSEFSVTVAWDMGVIARDRYNTVTGQHGRISGRALELAVRGKHLRASLMFAESLAQPDAFAKREHPVHFRLELLL